MNTPSNHGKGGGKVSFKSSTKFIPFLGGLENIGCRARDLFVYLKFTMATRSIAVVRMLRSLSVCMLHANCYIVEEAIKMDKLKEAKKRQIMKG